LENKQISDDSKINGMNIIVVNILLAIVGGVSLTCMRGIVYLYDCQLGYFLYGLGLYDPNFIPLDWQTWKAFQHHIAFGYLLLVLQKIGSLYVMTIISQIVIMTLFSYGLLTISRRFLKYPVHAYFAVVIFIGLARPVEMSLGGQPFIMGYLMPSEIAATLMIFGLAFLFEGRYFLAGTILGLAGLFHAQFLASFAPAILITAYAKDFWRDRHDLFSFLLPLALLWGILTIYVGYCLINSPPPTARIMRILTDFRAPLDNTISLWDRKDTLVWLLWIGTGSLAMYMLPRESKYRELRLCFITAIVTCLVGVAQAAFVKIPSITIMQLWRVAPLVMILSLLVIVDNALRVSLSPEEESKKKSIYIASLFIAGIVLVNISFIRSSPRGLLWMISIPLSLLAGAMVTRLTKGLISYSKAILASFLVIMIVIMGWSSYRGLMIGSHNHFLHPIPVSLGNMEKWVRENTPVNSIFVIPPDLEYMRIRARRAVVVDWKTAPVFASDMEEWYRRICDISDMPPNAPTYALLENGYRHLDKERAKMLRSRYGATFVVVKSKEHVGNLSGLMERFNNGDYKVLEIPSSNN